MIKLMERHQLEEGEVIENSDETVENSANIRIRRTVSPPPDPHTTKK